MRVIIVILLAMLLGGCVTPEIALDNCTRLGFEPGTDEHSGCALRLMEAELGADSTVVITQ